MKTIKFKENHEVKKGIFLLVFALLCNLAVSAQTEFVIGNLKYTTTTDSTVSVGKNETPTGELVIPASVEYEGTQYSVTSIGTSAFYRCDGLTSVTIPNSVTSIGNAAFSRCKSLTSVTIPNSVTSIGNSAFYYCTGLTSVTIPNSVTNIGKEAFFDCTGMSSVSIGNSVTSIGDAAFWGCKSLTSVTIPNSVTNIGEKAFYNCTGLTSIDIPNSVTSIGDEALAGCTKMLEINVDENNTIFSSIAGVLLDKSKTKLIQYPIGKQGAYTIPNSVTRIGDYAFRDCTGLTSVTIPNSVTRIGFETFRDCSSLISIDLPNSVTGIGVHAFYGCNGLNSINIPNSVTSIGGNAFYHCSGLIAINVDENNTAYSSIDGVLFNKSQTELIQFPERKQGAYTIPNSVTSIGNSSFAYCTGLTSVTIPNSVTSIGLSAFRSCTGLTSIDIPNSVTRIEGSAFASCKGLTSVTISNSVVSIGFYTFSGCKGLKDIYCYIKEPLTINSNVFLNVPKNTSTLHVSIGSKEKYEVADVWKDFLNIVEDLPTGIVSIDNSQLTIDNDVWHTLNGVRLNGKPTKAGIYIVNGKKVVVK